MAEEENSSSESKESNDQAQSIGQPSTSEEVSSGVSDVDMTSDNAKSDEGEPQTLSDAPSNPEELQSPNEADKVETASLVQDGQGGEKQDSASPNPDSPKKPTAADTLKKKLSALSKKQKKMIAIIAGVIVLIFVVLMLFAAHVICFHNWSSATCTEAETCMICGETRGEALGHEWIEATCTEPETCSVCGAMLGVPNGHKVAEWVIDEDSTCDFTGKKHGICSVCNEEVISPVEFKDHTPGEWEIVTEATETKDGTRIQKCTVCGAEIKKESYSLTPAQIKDNYIKSCQSYAFKDLARNADALAGKRIVAKGEVIQVQTEGSYYVMRVNITKGSYGIWSDTVYVVYSKPSGADNIIEDDIITFYGEIDGNTSYTSVMGAAITLPKITAKYIDIN